MFLCVDRIEQVLPCLIDPWKLRIIAHLNSPPDLKELAHTLDARYSESLGVVLVRLVNSILAMVAQKQLLKEQ